MTVDPAKIADLKVRHKEIYGVEVTLEDVEPKSKIDVIFRRPTSEEYAVYLGTSQDKAKFVQASRELASAVVLVPDVAKLVEIFDRYSYVAIAVASRAKALHEEAEVSSAKKL